MANLPDDLIHLSTSRNEDGSLRFEFLSDNRVLLGAIRDGAELRLEALGVPSVTAAAREFGMCAEAIWEVARSFTCLEIEAIVSLFRAIGESEASVLELLAEHAKGDDHGDLHGGDDE